MMFFKGIKLVSLIVLLCLYSSIFAITSRGDDAKAAYKEAVKLAKEKEYDYAFMQFRTFLLEFPDSEYADDSAFAICEYYYEKSMYNEAIKNIKEYIASYPESNATIIARAMLLKIMSQKLKPSFDAKDMISGIIKGFFSKPLLILFSDHKQLEYISPFQNSFLIRYYLDRIEVHKNGRLFIEIDQ